MELSEWQKEIHKTAKEKGWWDEKRNIPTMLLLIITEVTEACEADREGNYGIGKKDTFEDEIADTIIRLLDLCGGLGIDIEKQIHWKNEYNKGRERKHGKRY